MYLNFTYLKLRDGKYFMYPQRINLSDGKAIDGYSIDIALYPEIFEQDTNLGVMSKFYEGVLNLPKWSFDIAKYQADENPFVRFYPEENEWCRAAMRRAMLNEKIGIEIPLQTEIKKLRECLKNVLTYLKAKDTSFEDQAEFASYNSLIESKIAETPKETPETQALADKFNGKGDPFWFGE